SPKPIPAKFTVAILHSETINHVICSTVKSRLNSTGFKILTERMISLESLSDIHSLGLSEPTSEGLSVGSNLMYLLSRSRAVQVWKELVEPDPRRTDLPARSGSLRFMFGRDLVWAAQS
ncbi:hypothetical protein PPACK8108_LOCUS1563, partial [Phakopsora pachyrhizi]